MDRQHAHADWAFLPWGHFPERPNILLGAEIELASSFIKDRLNKPALLLMLLAVFVLTFLVAIPNALAPVALLQAISLLTARRTKQFGGGPAKAVGSVSLSFLSADSPSDMEPSCSAAAVVPSCLDDAMFVLQIIYLQAVSSGQRKIPSRPLDLFLSVICHAAMCRSGADDDAQTDRSRPDHTRPHRPPTDHSGDIDR